MTFEQTRDIDLIRRIVSHPRQFPTLAKYLGDDIYQRFADEKICLVARDQDEPFGLCILCPVNKLSAEIHVCLLPQAWGAKGVIAAIECIDWIWANTPFRRLIGLIAADNPLAIRWAAKVGMTQTGMREKSLIKEGIPRDVVVMEVEKTL